jgi:hypothetical protein
MHTPSPGEKDEAQEIDAECAGVEVGQEQGLGKGFVDVHLCGV